ncbi:MAG: TldD/PmbA family protein [Pseudobdellovibrionaceae bacterium]
MKPDLHKLLNTVRNQGDWVGLRHVQEINHIKSMRDGFLDRNSSSLDEGIMVEVMVDGHFGYAGTSDLSESGIVTAAKKAQTLASAAGPDKIFSFEKNQRPDAKGKYASPAQRKLDSNSQVEIQNLLKAACEKLKASNKIVSTNATSWIIETEFHAVSSSGSDNHQSFFIVNSDFSATAQDGTEVQKRSDNGGIARCNQIGIEIFDKEQVLQRCQTIGEQAVELLSADQCPTDTLDLVLMPDQMLLQIHESIGHPLELDRILGDERNFAGWSFVKPSDFGKLQYGSKLMNIAFDPTHPTQLASYAFDDAGNPATKEFLIKEGILQKGLGSLESQRRLNLQGVANSRSSSWNRAPIDRMANINLEPGTSSFDDIISSVKRGVIMFSNRSWSIDDYRNKFQFGCEYAKLIENGKLTKTLKNPNYRGTTVQFWNHLAKVGDSSTYEYYGSPFCGKGEPSQVIRVGHASPVCLFNNVEVFGGN